MLTDLCFHCWLLKVKHSHPLHRVGRLLLDEADAGQDVADVIDPLPGGDQLRHRLPQVQFTARRRQQQLQETQGQHLLYGVWTAGGHRTSPNSEDS